MADQKLTQLPEAPSVSPGDVLYAVVAGASRRVAVATLLAAQDWPAVAASPVAAGEAVYVTAAGQVAPARADDAATLPAVAIAMSGAAQGAAVTVRDRGRVKLSPSPGWTPGQRVYLSASATGALSQAPPASPGQWVQALGLALSADELLLSPDLVPQVVE